MLSAKEASSSSMPQALPIRSLGFPLLIRGLTRSRQVLLQVVCKMLMLISPTFLLSQAQVPA